MANASGSSLQWSAQYSTSTSRSQALSGDKILLPPSALEALLSASASIAVEHERREHPTFDPYNSLSYSIYRQTESQFRDQKQALPYPLTFRLVNPSNGKVVYAGIREFSAEEGEVVLSPFLQESLGLKDGTRTKEDPMEIDGEEMANGKASATITVHVRELPKGTFVKLRPLEAGYDEDWKALLEQHLRANYTTLTNGEVLEVPGSKTVGGKRQTFQFLVDGFRPDAEGVCIVDTDLEVDIEALNEEQARETLRRITAKLTRLPTTGEGSSTGGELSLFKPAQGQVLPGEYVDYELPSWNRSQPLEIEVSGENNVDRLDLLVSPLSATQRARPRLDEHVFSDFDGRPTKRIRLEPTNAALDGSEALFISVHGFDPAETRSNGGPGHTEASTDRLLHYTLNVRHTDEPTKPIGSDHHAGDVPPNEGDVRCKNCRQWVPQRTLILHENFCLRNNILCPKGCGQVFQKRSPEYQQHWHCPHDNANGNTAISQEKHNAVFHPPEVLRCPDCATRETFANIPALAHHRTSTCPAKLILCRFCHLEVAQEGDPDVPDAAALLSGMTPHELADGARTTECHLCNKIVRLRDMDIHLKNHDLDRVSRPPPRVCRNVYCGRTLDVCSKTGDTRAGTRMGQGPGNDIGLCSSCFGPLYVSMYDPDNKALYRRIERRYLQQLVTGCGKSWCRNEYCKTGRRNVGIEGTLTMSEALPIVKPFVDALSKGDHSSPLHFCVGEKSQQQRKMAEMLAAEDGGPAGKGGYALEWCVGALEAENGDLDKARQWLKNWAPTRNETRR